MTSGNPVRAEPVRLAWSDAAPAVSALWTLPTAPRAAYVLAHGAGAGMGHRFLEAVAAGLADRGIATLRYQFPFMERGEKRVDPPAVARAAVRAACAEATGRFPALPAAAGGKSFGGRMTSQAEASRPLPGIAGLAFLGFPLHPAGKPSVARAAHLDAITKPMLFLQGTRDALADAGLVATVAARLGGRAQLASIEAADHAFHVPARSGRNDAEVLDGMLETLAGWIVALPVAR